MIFNMHTNVCSSSTQYLDFSSEVWRTGYLSPPLMLMRKEEKVSSQKEHLFLAAHCATWRLMPHLSSRISPDISAIVCMPWPWKWTCKKPHLSIDKNTSIFCRWPKEWALGYLWLLPSVEEMQSYMGPKGWACSYCLECGPGVWVFEM